MSAKIKLNSIENLISQALKILKLVMKNLEQFLMKKKNMKKSKKV